MKIPEFKHISSRAYTLCTFAECEPEVALILDGNPVYSSFVLSRGADGLTSTAALRPFLSDES